MRRMQVLCAVTLAVCLLGGCMAAAPAGGDSVLPAAVSAGSASLQDATQPPEVAGPVFHFSVDDVLDVFADLMVNETVYQSAFENPMLGFLRGLHENYGVVTTLYCFYENHDASFDLSQVPARFAGEFAQNSHWLRFGFHAKNINTTYEATDAQTAAADYTRCMGELARIAGGESSIDRVVRLHWFKAPGAVLAALQNEPLGIVGLLAGVNENDANYDLPQAQQQAMFAEDVLWQDGLFYTPTDLWLEDIADFDGMLQRLQNGDLQNRGKTLVAFTHEYMMQDEEMQDRITQTAQFARENGYVCAFLDGE